ncbi:MAG: DUF192 domain-containing protein, partial [Planctomycetota bacterium]
DPPPTAPPGPPATAPDERPRESVTIAGHRFELELAADPAARRKGLMGRREIPADRGMLFVFPKPGYRSFWMAGCLIDIDIAFLDAFGTVVAVHRMKAEPPPKPGESQRAYEWRLRHYSSVRPAQYAIELRSGSIDRLKLKRGVKIKLDHERLTALARRNERPLRDQP